MTSASNYALRQARNDIAEKVVISNRIINQINYGMDLIDRLKTTYRPEDTMHEEIAEYIQEYESIRSMFSTESLGIEAGLEGVMDTVARIVRNLWAMLCKLWDNIRHCFHYLFSAQYRAQSNIINYRKKIAVAGEAINDKFVRYEVDAFITYAEFMALVNATSAIVTLLEGITQQPNIAAVEAYLNKESEAAGIKFVDNHFVDEAGDIPYKSGTYGALGWTIKLALDATAAASTCVGRQVKLKRVESDLGSEISAIKRDINNKVERGATSETLAEVEAKLAYKTKVFQLLQAGLLTLSGRLTQIDLLSKDLGEDADDLANGRAGADE